MKSKKLLDMFTVYCNEHPEERFWQALRNWSGYGFILVSNNYTPNDLKDTFHWEEDYTKWPR